LTPNWARPRRNADAATAATHARQISPGNCVGFRMMERSTDVALKAADPTTGEIKASLRLTYPN